MLMYLDTGAWIDVFYSKAPVPPRRIVYFLNNLYENDYQIVAELCVTFQNILVQSSRSKPLLLRQTALSSRQHDDHDIYSWYLTWIFYMCLRPLGRHNLQLNCVTRISYFCDSIYIDSLQPFCAFVAVKKEQVAQQQSAGITSATTCILWRNPLCISHHLMLRVESSLWYENNCVMLKSYDHALLYPGPATKVLLKEHSLAFLSDSRLKLKKKHHR